MKEQQIPLFEFDPCKTGYINAENDYESQDISEISAKVAVVCFFKEAIKRYLEENECKIIVVFKSEMIDLPLYLDIKKNILFMQGCIGGPLASAQIELIQYLGVKKIITCGGAGVLRDIAVGHLMIPTSAVRDEGTSYHYAKPSYEIGPDLSLTKQVTRWLTKKGLPYIEGKTWTIDAAYRETSEKVELRRNQGCLCVEMECASFFAVASFRNVAIASVLYGGDSLTSDVWDNRDWNKRVEMRYILMNHMMNLASDL